MTASCQGHAGRPLYNQHQRLILLSDVYDPCTRALHQIIEQSCDLQPAAGSSTKLMAVYSRDELKLMTSAGNSALMNVLLNDYKPLKQYFCDLNPQASFGSDSGGDGRHSEAARSVRV